MSRGQQRLAGYLAHRLEAIQRIERYTEDIGEVVFLENQMAQDAVIRNRDLRVAPTMDCRHNQQSRPAGRSHNGAGSYLAGVSSGSSPP